MLGKEIDNVAGRRKRHGSSTNMQDLELASRLPTPPPSISSLSDFVPTVVMFLRKLPVVGPILNMPGVKNVVNKIAPKGSLPM